jgi:hypothetical protein
VRISTEAWLIVMVEDRTAIDAIDMDQSSVTVEVLRTRGMTPTAIVIEGLSAPL